MFEATLYMNLFFLSTGQKLRMKPAVPKVCSVERISLAGIFNLSTRKKGFESFVSGMPPTMFVWIRSFTLRPDL